MKYSKLITRAIVYMTLLTSIIITPLAYNVYDLKVQKQEYDAQVSLLKAGYQQASAMVNIFSKKKTLDNAILCIGYTITAIVHSFAASQVTEEYQTARQNDPKTYWQKVKKFWKTK